MHCKPARCGLAVRTEAVQVKGEGRKEKKKTEEDEEREKENAKRKRQDSRLNCCRSRGWSLMMDMQDLICTGVGLPAPSPNKLLLPHY